MDVSLLATILRELRNAGWVIQPPKTEGPGVRER